MYTWPVAVVLLDRERRHRRATIADVSRQGFNIKVRLTFQARGAWIVPWAPRTTSPHKRPLPLTAFLKTLKTRSPTRATETPACTQADGESTLTRSISPTTGPSPPRRAPPRSGARRRRPGPRRRPCLPSPTAATTALGGITKADGPPSGGSRRTHPGRTADRSAHAAQELNPTPTHCGTRQERSSRVCRRCGNPARPGDNLPTKPSVHGG